MGSTQASGHTFHEEGLADMSLAQFDAKAASGLFRTVTSASIDGRGRFPGAVVTARQHLHRQYDSADAVEATVDADDRTPAVDLRPVIRDVVEQHVRLAGAQGFVTSLGGFAVLPLALPANITGLAVLQTRMVGAIAFLLGHDVSDPRVRTAIVACLFGRDAVHELVRKGRLPYGPSDIATATDNDSALERKVATLLGTALTARVGGKRLGIAVSRRVPLLGGGVGAVADAVATYKVGRYAEQELAGDYTPSLPAADESVVDESTAPDVEAAVKNLTPDMRTVED